MWVVDIAKIVIAVNYLRKTLQRRCLTEFWTYLWFYNVSEFWRYQSSEYTSGSEYARVLNMLMWNRVLNMLEYAWLIPEYVWLCLNMPECALICLHLPQWLLVLHFSIVIPCLPKRVVTYFNVYTKLDVRLDFLFSN